MPKDYGLLTDFSAKTVSPIRAFKFDLQKLRKAIHDAIERFPFDHMNQLCLTSVREGNQSLYEGTGSLFDFQNQRWLAHEREFVFFNEGLKDSHLYQVYKDLQFESGWNIGRVRIMKLESRRCYSFHRDLDFRLHIAIETDPQSLFIFHPGGLAHIPADGTLYFANTLLLHTAMNASSKDRIHLVFSTFA